VCCRVLQCVLQSVAVCVTGYCPVCCRASCGVLPCVLQVLQCVLPCALCVGIFNLPVSFCICTNSQIKKWEYSHSSDALAHPSFSLCICVCTFILYIYTRCNTLQHTLQHARCNTLQHTLQRPVTHTAYIMYIYTFA